MEIKTGGFCDPEFENVRTVFNGLLSSGADLGSSFCATWKGRTVVDIWGGYLDEDKQMEWQEDTLVNVFSTTKTMSFLCALLLADQGELDFNAPVSRYWPEFSANGKNQVLTWFLQGFTGFITRFLPGFSRLRNPRFTMFARWFLGFACSAG